MTKSHLDNPDAQPSMARLQLADLLSTGSCIIYYLLYLLLQ